MLKNVVLFAALIFIFENVDAKETTFPSDSVFHLKDEWKSQEGKTFHLKDFAGKPTVFAMVYTSCQHTCPMITSKVQEVQKGLAKKFRDKINLSLISFDPLRDTPEKLRKYKKKRKLGSQWVLLTGTDSSARKLAAVVGVNYKKEGDADYSHSNIVTLLDKNGVIVDQIKDLSKETKNMTNKIEMILKEK